MNGDQMIARVESHDEYGVTLVDAMSLVFTESADGRTLIFLTKYFPFIGDYPIRIALHNVVYVGATMNNVVEYYNRSVEYSELKMEPAFDETVSEVTSYVNELIQTHMIESTGSPKLRRPKDDADVSPGMGDVDMTAAFRHAPSDTKH